MFQLITGKWHILYTWVAPSLRINYLNNSQIIIQLLSVVSLSYGLISSTCDTDNKYDDGVSLTQSQDHCVTGTAEHVAARPVEPETLNTDKAEKTIWLDV